MKFIHRGRDEAINSNKNNDEDQKWQDYNFRDFQIKFYLFSIR